MKSIKFLSALITISIVSYMMISVMNAAQSDIIKEIKLDSIEQLVLSRNTAIRSNNASLTDAASIDAAVNQLKILQKNITDAQETLVLKTTQNQPSNPSDPQTDLFIIYSDLKMVFDNYLNNLAGQISSLSSEKNNLFRSVVQIDLLNSAIVWSAQQLYFSYCSVRLQRQELSNKLSLLEKQITIAKTQLSLGLISSTDFMLLNSQFNDNSEALKSLMASENLLKGQINIMLAQDYDTELTINDPDTISENLIQNIDYNKDLERGMIQNKKIILQNTSELLDEEKRNFKLSFRKIYQKVQDNVSTLKLQNEKLTYEGKKLDISTFKLNKGLIAQYEYDTTKSSFESEILKVKKARLDVASSYTGYQWIIRGVVTE